MFPHIYLRLVNDRFSNSNKKSGPSKEYAKGNTIPVDRVAITSKTSNVWTSKSF